MNDQPQHGVLGRLGGIDPARSLPDAATADDEALHRILDAPPGVVNEDLLPGERRGPLVAASVAAVVALGAGALVWSVSAGGPVYASWESEPALVTQAQRQLVEDQCPGFVHRIDGSGTSGVVEIIEVEPVLIDVRGDYTYVISSDGGEQFSQCFVVSEGAPFAVATDRSLDAGVFAALSEPESGVSVLQAGTAEWSETAEDLPGALTAAFGRASGDVDAVILYTDSGIHVRATVNDGWWAAWAPGDETFAQTITVVLGDGATATQELLEGSS